MPDPSSNGPATRTSRASSMWALLASVSSKTAPVLVAVVQAVGTIVVAPLTIALVVMWAMVARVVAQVITGLRGALEAAWAALTVRSAGDDDA